MDIKEAANIVAEYVSGLAVLDGREEIIWADHTAEKACGGGEIIKKKFNEVFSLTLGQIMEKPQIITSLSGQKYSIKAHMITKESQCYTLIVINEITDLHSIESRLYCLEKIIESIDDGVIISDYEGRLVLYNSAQEKMEGLSARDVVGKYLWEAYNYHAEEMSEHRKVYKSGLPILNKYLAHAYHDGVPRYLSYSTYPITRDGEVIAVYSISKNETRLQSLLSETIELKRQLFSKNKIDQKKYQVNGTKYTFVDVVGESSAILSLIKEAQTIAMLDSTVLIVGETGTGKEVLAQSIHNFSDKQKKPFIAINCAAIPESLLESILFGTVKGAYTGAIDQVGLFEEAREGTLFLDEINSMPLSLQSKLLRVLQEKTVRRVGGLGITPIHCRVICAANEDPQKLIRDGILRQDLFYRIAGICLYIPPLRQRREDIMCLTDFFINKYNSLLNKRVKSLSAQLKELLFSYKWPGNVRELEHLIENLMIRVENSQSHLDISNMPPYLREMIIVNNVMDKAERKKDSLPATLRDVERKIILESLNKSHWNLSETAKDLGIIRQSLQYRIKKLGIEKK